MGNEENRRKAKEEEGEKKRKDEEDKIFLKTIERVTIKIVNTKYEIVN